MLPSLSRYPIPHFLPWSSQEGTRQMSLAAHPSRDPRPYPVHNRARNSQAVEVSINVLVCEKVFLYRSITHVHFTPGHEETLQAATGSLQYCDFACSSAQG